MKSGTHVKRIMAWELLVNNGYFKNRKEAESWFLSGNVYINNVRIDKPGDKVPMESDVFIKDFDKKYVGRGGYKLEAALDAFGLDVSDIVAIDAGASTGGFTDCLIQRGAKRVYSVDVGYGQLAGKLRVDSRVVNLERVNLSDAKKYTLNMPPVLATLDLSYLSFKKAVPIAKDILNNSGDIIYLIKPLYEIHDPIICRTGLIEDNKIYKELLIDLVNFAEDKNLTVKGLIKSPITGNNGAIEFLMHMRMSEDDGSQKYDIKNINTIIDDLN